MTGEDIPDELTNDDVYYNHSASVSGGGGGGGYNGGKGGDGTGTSPDTAGGASYYDNTVFTNTTTSILSRLGDPGTGNSDGAPDGGQVVITKL